MKKLLISAVLSSALLISGSLSAKTLKFQISSKAGDWAHTYLNTKNNVHFPQKKTIHGNLIGVFTIR